MEYGEISGVDKPVSRLVMGSMVLSIDRLPFSFALLDRFAELGGTAIDTAYVYGGGKSEPAVGNWIKDRNLRDRVVLIAKGAATTSATPEIVSREMAVSLDRFGLDYADVYLMHRDNVGVPVGEFVDCLNQHRLAGRIRAYGGSNWTTDRLQAANEYAAAHNIPGFAASSPNFSLAHWNEPMWDSCLTAVDQASREWYARTQMPLLSWSSQASGFFTGRFSPRDAGSPEASEVARVWFNDGNWERLRRAGELAQKRGVSPLQIALAYVLRQTGINMFALIGPANESELESSAGALDIGLSQDELAWLDLSQ